MSRPADIHRGNRDESNRQVYRTIYSQGQQMLRYPDEILVSYAYQTLRHDPAMHAILDVGCGAGRHVHLFADMNFEAHGLDPSMEAITFAKERLLTNGLDGRLVCGICSAIPYPDARFDAVLCWGVVNTIVEEGELHASMGDMLRVLRPNGRLLISLSSYEDAKCKDAENVGGSTYRIEYQGAEYYCRFWSRQEAVDFLKGYGLKVERVGYVLRCVNFDSDQPVAYHVAACRKTG